MGLEGITSIGGDLLIIGNDSLTSLTGLEGLDSIGGGLSIGCNAALTSLAGPEGLTYIGGSLSIGYNNALTNLTGLDNIDVGSINDLYINNNTLLSTCEVQSICNYLVSPNGTIEIHDNANGCDSQEEVHLACTFGLDEEGAAEDPLYIYPNPSYGVMTLELPPNTLTKNTSLTIYNINGQQLIWRQITEQQTVVDVSGMVSGLYFVRVIGDDGVQVGKFMKR
jgi:hypothetical protein